MAQITCSTDRRLTVGLFISMATIFTLFHFYTPLQLDDYVFLSVYRDATGGFDFSFKGLWDFVMNIRMFDNSRFSNVVAPVFSAMQPWNTLFPFIAGLITASLPLFIIRFAGIRNNRSLAYILIWSAMVIFLPWRDSLLVMDYNLNYPFAAFFTFAFVGLLFYNTRKNFPRLLYVLVIVVAIVAGGWHEGFALPTCGGLGVLALTRRMRMPVKWYIVVGVYFAVALVVMLCPGMLKRIFRETGASEPIELIKMIADFSLVIALIVMVLCMLAWRRTRGTIIAALRNPALIVFGVAMVLSGMLSVVVHHTARTAFYTELCAIIVVIMLLKPWLVSIARSYTVMSIVTLYGLLIFHGVSVIQWQYRFNEQDRKLMSLFDESQTGTVYYDIIMPTDVPIYTLYFPTRTSHAASYHYFWLDQMWPEKFHSVVPSELRDFNDSRCLSSDSADCIFVKGKSLWMHDLPDLYKPSGAYLNIRLGDGSSLESHPASAQRFIAQSGDTLVYLMPHNLRTADIVDVNLASYITVTGVVSLDSGGHARK